MEGDSQESVSDENEVKRFYAFILCHIILQNLVFSFMVYNENFSNISENNLK